jgi:hypothetical protein
VVTCVEDALALLDAGALARATSGTLLNEQSSRSHAIFSICVEQSSSGLEPPTAAAASDSPVNDDAAAGQRQVTESRCAKLHLVDLAGSERVGRSGAVGARFKETVNINQVH